ncbi:LysR family transcriptional regulator [Rhizobium sullae]|uniref:LysR family transcriptional regulator n=1 Tax=Rhizobium sullae TaxID=50338 RepID=UPI000B36323A|nr:LysR family transcriptional regulator [Rhizobium sullae]
MFDWENLRYFAALAQTGTLLGAARLLGVEHATVARRVARLEAQMGVKLIDRRGRRVSLTADGERVAVMAERMGEEARAIERVSLAAGGGLAGDVTVSAPPTLAAALLAGPLVELRRNYPDIGITIVGETRYASLDRREADIAVRMTKPEQGDFTVTKLGDVAFGFYASPAYLASVPEEAWSFIAYDETMSSSPQSMRLLDVANGRKLSIRATTLEFQLSAAKAGGGVALLPNFLLAGANDLVEVIRETKPLTREVWLVVHSDIRNVPIIRAVMETLKRNWSY